MLEDKYNICEAENGKQAVEILERCHKDFKLVLLDLVLCQEKVQIKYNQFSLFM